MSNGYVGRLLGLPLGIIAATTQAGQVLDEVVIVGESQLVEQRITLEGDALRIANTADFLKTVPGANLNRNGPITALPQYRGASGDRINVQVDGLPLIAGGPNGMDSPVSSVPGANVQTLSVSRGIASVSRGQETLGGAVAIDSRQGRFTESDQFSVNGRFNALYNSNNHGSHVQGLTYLANRQQKLGLSFTYQNGDDSEFDGGDKNSPNSFFRRNRLAGFYGYDNGDAGIAIGASRVNTQDTGTASLPMDIRYVDADSAHMDGFHGLGDWQLAVALGSQRIDHGMDNFSHRPTPTMTMGMMTMPMARYTDARGEHDHSKLSLAGPALGGDMQLGVDYSTAIHDAAITDPNNPAFFLHNFHDVNRDITGLYGEWVRTEGSLAWELGVRSNRIRTDSETVSFTGMPAMMAMNLMPLAQAFNNADRSQTATTLDWVAKAAWSLRENFTASLGVARKTRGPSYQELFLWAPLQSTGGLADGRNYLGNLTLDPEVGHELNLGLDIQSDALNVSFQAFYRQVEDYIQGTPNINSPFVMQVQMASNAMGGQDALQFNNVDAVLYGADLGYQGQWQAIYYRGTLSYVRGERDDINDNLYRIAPLNHYLTLGSQQGDWDFSVTSEWVASQSRVSRYNNEQTTAGYGLLHVNLRWQQSEQIQWVLGIDNLFDKVHDMHLNGYNRVAASDVPQGDRLPGQGRNLRLGASLQF